ncbi:FKBP-type peptidyl-prolyl cis-trans isomerase [Mucilaginibacter sp.]
MNKKLMLLAVAAAGLASCNSGFKKGEGGLLYSIHTDKPGQTVKEGDFISLNLIAKNDADSVLFSTYDAGKPVPAMMPKPQMKGDVYAGIKMLSEGDSATIKVAADSVFKKGQPKPPGFKGKYIVYEVKVDKVIPKGNQTDAVFQARVQDYFKAQSQAMGKMEPGKIKKYIDDNKLKVTTTADGLMYQITQQGSGANIMPGDTAVVNYTGKLTNGTVFDTSIKEVAQKNKKLDPMRRYEPIHIPVGVKAVIPGWDEGLLLLSKGSKATFVIPSKLAYGEQGLGPVPPHAPIAFDVELVDIIHPNPNAPKPAAPAAPMVR